MNRGIQDEWAADAALGETHDVLLCQHVADELDAEELLHGTCVGISAVDGVVILEGTVHTQSQHKQAEAVASAAGARAVRNELRVTLG